MEVLNELRPVEAHPTAYEQVADGLLEPVPLTREQIEARRQDARMRAQKAKKKKQRLMVLRVVLVLLFVGLAVTELIRPDLLAVGLGALALPFE